MEIAGSTCKVCGQRIVLAREGKACSACRIVVHRGCDDQHTCALCGKRYEGFEPPVADVARDAVLPRSLRPGRTSSGLMVVVLAALLLFFMLFLIVFFTHPHG